LLVFLDIQIKLNTSLALYCCIHQSIPRTFYKGQIANQWPITSQETAKSLVDPFFIFPFIVLGWSFAICYNHSSTTKFSVNMVFQYIEVPTLEQSKFVKRIPWYLRIPFITGVLPQPCCCRFLAHSPVVNCDNQSTVAFSHNPVLHPRIKIVGLDFYFLCKRAMQSVIF
jgi:hypothetical protein